MQPYTSTNQIPPRAFYRGDIAYSMSDDVGEIDWGRSQENYNGPPAYDIGEEIPRNPLHRVPKPWEIRRETGEDNRPQPNQYIDDRLPAPGYERDSTYTPSEVPEGEVEIDNVVWTSAIEQTLEACF
jgi:hypothetical protein